LDNPDAPAVLSGTITTIFLFKIFGLTLTGFGVLLARADKLTLEGVGVNLT